MSFKLLKSTLVIGFMTTISRIFGLIRDIVIGSVFGPGLGVDVFIVSFRIPNFLRRNDFRVSASEKIVYENEQNDYY